MRYLGGVISAVLALTSHDPAFGDSTVDYSAGIGRSSNIFQDTSELPASFSESRLGLRGSLDLESSHLTYRLAAGARRVGAYRFADRKSVGGEVGYAIDLSPAAKLTLKAGVEAQRDGDLFLALPGTLIGYSKTDLAANASAGLSIEHNGGRSHLTASLAGLQHGKAHFTLPGLNPTRLDADDTLLDLTGGHIRPLFGGEAGLTLQYRDNQVPKEDRETLESFPARALRGSVAYGRRFGDSVTMLAELGLVHVDSPYLGDSVRRFRPYMKGQLAWQPQDGLTLTARLAQDIRLADIDDPLGEDVRTLGLLVEKALTDRLKIGFGYGQDYSDWLYYDYRTRTHALSASMTVGINQRHAFVLDFSRLLRRESDPDENFSTSVLAARITGAF